MKDISLHKFHIPVMGLAYTIDSPVKVAKFGIASVISIVEDRLVEMMRRHYYPSINKTYEPIETSEPDYRARRITDYLNLVDTIVQQQVEKLKQLAFETGSDIVKYFEMLPSGSELKQQYLDMLGTADAAARERKAEKLRSQIKPGSIDVNIMTKTDRENYDAAAAPIADGSDAVAALRGYANSNLKNSSVIFSAGMNPRLYNYLSTCPQFDVDEDGCFQKRVVVKVSDYRSALIQGKYLAKKGIWVSEFRIESGLNCGGHAFATEGYLMGPILEEFSANRQALVDTLFEMYNAVHFQNTGKKFKYPPQIKFSAQGGIGTGEEAGFLLQQYELETTGWGTPFLLVPEATTVDEATLKLLCDAQEQDILLSKKSPLGVRFHYLSGSTSEKEKLKRIANGRPGSPCTEKHLAFNTEFTKEPICTASRKYQKLKIAQLEAMDIPEADYKKQLSEVLDKECLCVGLSNAAAINYDQPFLKNLHAVNICPGPNIAHFNKVVSLQQMTDHIYARSNTLTSAERPHMFIAELQLYINYLTEQIRDAGEGEILPKTKKYHAEFYKNLMQGIEYYRQLSGVAASNRPAFLRALDAAENALAALLAPCPAEQELIPA